MIILYILLAILVLELLIFIHELGHYSMGKLLGFRIMDFSLGFGPKLLSFRRGETNYALRAIPFGGSCQFDGEDQDKNAPGAFNTMPIFKRLLVLIAGPAMNILFAFVIAIVLLMCTPQYDYLHDSVTGEYLSEINLVQPDSPADKAQLKEGDLIIEVNGVRPISKEGSAAFSGVTDLIGEAEADFTMLIERDGELMLVEIHDAYNQEAGKNLIGVSIGGKTVGEGYHLTFFQAVAGSADYVATVVRATAQAIGGMFTNGVHRGDVTGIVGTVAFMADVASDGLQNLVAIAVIISLSLGIFNLIPFPALDGGRVLFLLIEAVIGKRINRKVEAAINAVGLMLLFGFMIFITVFDVLGLFGV